MVMYFRFSSSASCITFDDDGNLDLHTHNRPKYTHTHIGSWVLSIYIDLRLYAGAVGYRSVNQAAGVPKKLGSSARRSAVAAVF